MKKLFFIAIAVWIQIPAYAQSWSIGVAGIYGDDIKSPGAHVRGYYNFKNEKVCFGPEYSYFFEHIESHDGFERSKRLNEFNFNLHYVIEFNEQWGFYPLTGINLSIETEELVEESFSEKETISELGANLGLGVHKKLSHEILLFAEYDHLFSKLHQNSYLIGIFWTFGKKSEKQTHE